MKSHLYYIPVMMVSLLPILVMLLIFARACLIEVSYILYLWSLLSLAKVGLMIRLE